MNENKLRERIAYFGASLYQRSLTAGTSGNISVRLDDGWLMTPTNCCLGEIDPAAISKLDTDFRHIAGDTPTKESFMHLAMYSQRPRDQAVVHLHSTHSVAVSCLENIDPGNVLPALTPYFVKRVGKLALAPYFKPGDRRLADAVEKLSGRHHAILLANHGPVIAGDTLANAVYICEELEETAKLYLLLLNQNYRRLSDQQIDELKV